MKETHDADRVHRSPYAEIFRRFEARKTMLRKSLAGSLIHLAHRIYPPKVTEVDGGMLFGPDGRGSATRTAAPSQPGTATCVQGWHIIRGTRCGCGAVTAGSGGGGGGFARN